MSEVEYRGIRGFEGYRVGSDGTVWSRWRIVGLGYGRGTTRMLSDNWKLLKPIRHATGYFYVDLYCDGRSKRIAVHVCVLFAFCGPPPATMESCHGDGDRANNQLSNLRWDKREENTRDRIRHGRQPRGELHHQARITAAQAALIKDRLEAGEMGRAIAKDLKLSESIVSRIKRGVTWT